MRGKRTRLLKCFRIKRSSIGRLAQLVRAPALQAGGPRFEPATAHHAAASQTSMSFMPAVRPASISAQATCRSTRRDGRVYNGSVPEAKTEIRLSR
jgi:hypothetical protein